MATGDNGNPGLSAPMYVFVDFNTAKGTVILLHLLMVETTARLNLWRSQNVISKCRQMRSVAVRKAST